MQFQIFILLLLPALGISQGQYRFDHFTIKNGLSQNTVHTVLKDSEGYYWLGTQDGLNRYDGYSVKVFRHDKNDSTTLSDNFILTLTEDNFGNIWVGTRNGFNHYDKKTGRFTKVISNKKEQNDYHACVWNSILDNAGNILYSNFYSQLVKITKEDSKSAPFTPKIVAENKVLFKNTGDSYFLATPTNTSVSSYDLNHNIRWEAKELNLDRINSILETEKGEKLIGTESGMYQIENDGRSAVRINSVQGKSLNKLHYDSRKNIWAGTSAGLYIFEKGDISTPPVLLTHLSEEIHSLGSNSVQELYEDPDGLVWVGTSEGGVSIFDPEKNIFKIINHSSPVSLSANSIWGIYQDKNDLWVGTNSGLNHLTFQDSCISTVYSGKNKLVSSEVFWFSNTYPHCIAGNSITSITKDKKGGLWFASNNNGISVFDPAKKTWKQFNTKNTPIKSDHIFHLLCASDGKMWISTLAGFYCYDPEKNEFQSFLSTALEKSGFPSGYIISIYEDTQRNIWVGSTGGVFHLKSTGETIALYKSEPTNPASLSYNMATSFLEDSKGRMWISTLGGGINLFNPASNSFRSFTKKDGLANDVTYKILEDKKGKLWISTNAGISCFDPEKKTFANFSEKDGVVANEFSQNAGYINKAGDILFGSPEGLLVFNPREIKTRTKDVPLILTSLKVNYETAGLSQDNSLNLNYGDKTVTFEFTSPDFRNQEKIQYAFLLEGFDDAWHEVPASNRIASFTNLPFGNYTFKVRARTGNNTWQKQFLTIPVNVIAPFWLRSWFILLEILAGIALIVFLVRYYAQRKLKQKLREVEIQQKMHLEKERISRDLHDNVGAHLTYIITSLDNISYKMEKGEIAVAPDKITSLSDFSRSTIQQLRESIWAINKENITLEELKDKIGEYSGKMASAGNMSFSIEFNSSKEKILKPSHAINIYRIVQEAINNSVKHSRAKALSVSISKNEAEQVSIDVKDNGNGMAREANSNGYGLKNMKDRVKDLGGEIAIDSNEKGTKVSFTIPI